MNDPYVAGPLRSGSRRKPVRVVGAVADVDADGRRLLLDLDDGVRIPCYWRESTAHPALPAGSRLTVSGTAVWTLEGRLVRIDADALADGTGEAPAWSRTPSMPSAVSNLPETAPSPPRLGLAALVGLVPEHETSGSPDGAKGGT